MKIVLVGKYFGVQFFFVSHPQSNGHYICASFSYWEFRKTLDDRFFLILYSIWWKKNCGDFHLGCNVANSSIIHYLHYFLVAGLIGHEKKCFDVDINQAAKTANINSTYKLHFAEEWNVKKCSLIGAVSTAFPLWFFFFIFGCSRFSRRVCVFSLVLVVLCCMAKTKWLYFMLVGYESHYTYNRFIYESMADMFVKYVPTVCICEKSCILNIEWMMMMMAMATYLRPEHYQ